MASQEQCNKLFEDARSVGVLKSMADEVQRGASYGTCQDLVIKAAARENTGGVNGVALVSDDDFARSIVNPQLRFGPESKPGGMAAIAGDQRGKGPSPDEIDDDLFAQTVKDAPLVFYDV